MQILGVLFVKGGFVRSMVEEINLILNGEWPQKEYFMPYSQP
jgi:hypothetical protein